MKEQTQKAGRERELRHEEAEGPAHQGGLDSGDVFGEPGMIGGHVGSKRRHLFGKPPLEPIGRYVEHVFLRLVSFDPKHVLKIEQTIIANS